MATKSNSGGRAAGAEASVEVTIEMLREQIMGMRTTIKSSAAPEAITEKDEESENRLRERHRRDTERRVQDHANHVLYLQEQIDEEEKRNNILMGRLEQCRSAKNQAMAELNQNREKYDKRVKELERCIAESRKELSLLQIERDKLSVDNSRMKELEDLVEEYEKALIAEKKLAEEFKNEAKALYEKLELTKNETQQLQELLDSVERENKNIKKQLDNYVKEMKEKTDAITLRTVLEDQLEKSKEMYEESLAKLNLELARAQKAETELVAKAEKNKDTDSVFIRKIASLNNEITGLNSEKQELTKRIMDLEDEDAKAKRLMEANNIRIDELKNKIKVHNEELQVSASEKQKLKNEIEKLELHVETLQVKFERLEADREKLDMLVKEKLLIIKETSEQVELKNQEIKKLKSSIITLKEALTILDEQLISFQQLVEQKTGELEAAEKMHGLLDGENRDLREQLRKCRIELNEEKSKNAYTQQCLQKTQNTLKNQSESNESEVTAIMRKLEVANFRTQELTSEVIEITNKLSELEGEKFELRKAVEGAKSDRERYGKDFQTLLKSVVDVKDTNVKLNGELQKAVDQVMLYRDEVEEQQAKIASLEESLTVKEVMYNTRTQQQNKLIEHLTNQLFTLQEKAEKKRKLANLFTPKRQEKDVCTPKTPLFPTKKQHASSTTATPLCLEEERLALMKLEKTREQLQQELHTLQNQGTPITSRTQTLPAPKKEECLLLKDTRNTIAGYARGACEKFHRFFEKPSENTMICLACHQPVVKGSLVAKCEKCGYTVHYACSESSSDSPRSARSDKDMPKVVLAIRKTEWSSNGSEDGDENSSSAGDYTEGWANVLTEKMYKPEKRFLKIEGTHFNVYMSEHSVHKPVESFKLNEFTSIHFRIDSKEEDMHKTALKENCKFAMKIIFYKSERESSYIFLFLQNKVEKRVWSRVINKYSKMHFFSGDSTVFSDLSSMGEEKPKPPPVHFDERAMLEQDGNNVLYINCATVFPKSRQFVLGCDDGLYSLNGVGATPVKIKGPESVLQIVLLKKARMVAMVEGKDKVLSTADYRLFKSCADAAECSEPHLTTEVVPKTRDCYNLAARCTAIDDTTVVVASGTSLLVCKIGENGTALSLIKELNVKESITSLLITPHSILFGNYDVFEIDLQNFHFEEFLDTSFDAIYLMKNVYENYGNYPVAILDVTLSNGKDAAGPEYLICFQDLGIFVDSFGRPTRDGELLWTQIPMDIEYRHPFLYIFHPTNIEVKKLDKNSYRKFIVEKPVSSKEGSEKIVHSRIHTPVSRFYPMKPKCRSSPRFLGKGEHGVVFAINETRSTKVFELIST